MSFQCPQNPVSAVVYLLSILSSVAERIQLRQPAPGALQSDPHTWPPTRGSQDLHQGLGGPAQPELGPGTDYLQQTLQLSP